MGIHAQLMLVSAVSVAVFFVVGVVLSLRGWFLRAGLAMILVSIVPMVWQVTAVPDSDAPGTAFFAMALSPFSFGVLIIGAFTLVFRNIGKLLRQGQRTN